MKRTFLLFLCLFMILSFGCTDNKLEEKPRKTISMPDTTSHPVSLQVEKKENVLNVLYPYLTYQNEYVKVFDQISALCQKELGLSVNLLTPDSSRLSVVNPGDKILLTRTEMYIYTIKSLMDAGIGPDIFFTTCMVDEVSRHNFKRQQSGFSNDLMTLIHYNYATELSPYINDKTPYLKKYRANMSNLDSLTEYKGGVYGILAPPDYKVLPVFVIRRDYNSRLDNQNHNTLHNAIDACIELNKKNVVTVHDRIVFDAKIVLSKIISDCGYYEAFISARNMYYFHKNDLLFKLHRIDDTPILDSIKKYKELFEQGSIFTSKDEKKEMVAGLMSYYSFLMSGLELAEYDIFFLEDIPVDYRSLDNIFVVSNTCINKQGATQFIDFLISDPEANFLLKYGLENLTYEIDSELGVVCTNSGYSSVSAVGGYTTGYDFLIAEYFYVTTVRRS